MSPILDGRRVSVDDAPPALAGDTALAREWLRAGVELLLGAWTQLEEAEQFLRRIQRDHVEPMAGSDRDELLHARIKLAGARQAVLTMRRGLAELLARLVSRREVRP